MATPVATIDATGLHLPSYDDVLTYLKNAYKGVYGQDCYLEPDSQDGQLLAIFAAAINDANSMAVACYNSFSPSTAQGTGLSRVVKINGIARAIATYSTVDLTIVGQVGTTITNGVAQDANGNRWSLPASVTIPNTGSIVVTATAQSPGSISASSGTVTQIATPTYGWQSVTNASAAVSGAPVETDAALRRRQSISTALPSRTVLEGIVGAVAALDGVTRYAAYENDSDATDSNGVPSHSIALVVEGGLAADIATAIAAKKGAGSGTYGTTTQTVTDVYGIPHAIKFFRPTAVNIGYAVAVKALPGFTTAIQAQIQQAIVDWTNGLAIGDDVLLTRAYLPANLFGGAGFNTFEITSVQMSKNGGSLGTADIPIAFNEAATTDLAHVTLTVS